MTINIDIIQGLLDRLEVYQREYYEVVERGEDSELRIVREMREGKLLPFYCEVKEWFLSVSCILETMLFKRESDRWVRLIDIEGIEEGGALQNRFDLTRNMLKALEEQVEIERQEYIALEDMVDGIRMRANAIDGDILVYLQEAVKCLMLDAVLASVVMIGGASELVVSRLINVYGESIRESEEQRKFLKMIQKERSIARRFDELIDSMIRVKNVPKNVNMNDSIKLIRNMFEWYRYTRNVGGHPEIRSEMLSKVAVVSNLHQFPSYLERICILIDFFEDEGVILKEIKGRGKAKC